jgi:hypothetical protein
VKAAWDRCSAPKSPLQKLLPWALAGALGLALVAPDGRFVMFPSDDTEISGVHLARVVVNWFPELTRVAPRR